MRKLLIVESPGKIKTLKKILGPEWLIEASIGHITELGFDGPRRWGFEFKSGRVVTHYVPRGDRAKVVLQKLSKVVSKVDEVVLATDPDREGEAIAWHLVEQLKPKKFSRVTYTQITDAAVRKAIANPLQLNTDLISAQRARQCLDKLVGFEVSPLLWNSTGGKSAGRVQSATLHLICERERERERFKSEKYWTLKAKYQNPVFDAAFEYEAAQTQTAEVPSQGEGAVENDNHKLRVRSREEADKIYAEAMANTHRVSATERKEENKNPPPPLITSSLQQVAGVRFKFSPKQTMRVAQELYEGVGGSGLITYMRTDAVSLSPEFIDEARSYLRQSAPEALPEKPPTYRTKADAQGAHEAIRPTSAFATPDSLRSRLSADQFKIYSLIWERAMASQSKPARLAKSKIVLIAGTTRWVARGTVVLDPGYLRFWRNLEGEQEIPVLAEGVELRAESVKITEQETKPPPRYSEPRLVQLMERKGIGRPSTYASTIATLKDRQYVELEQSVLKPTPLGMATDEALTKALPELVNTDFTAQMESQLDAIAEGKLAWESYLCSWNSEFFEPALQKAREALRGVVRVAPLSNRAGGEGGQGTRAVAGTNSVKTPDPSIERALSKARKLGAVPKCQLGHGEMVLRKSQKKDTFYWKCLFPECQQWAWFVQFSTEKCPECERPLEKIPSKKVEGKYFLKCAQKEKHQSKTEVVLFKNRKTKAWERATPRPHPSPLANPS